MGDLTDHSGFNDFGTTLVEAGLLYPTGILGVFGRSQHYADVAAGLHDLVDDWGADLGAVEIQFPPVGDRSKSGHTNYVPSFPGLRGAIHVFTGDDRDHAELVRRS